jgi:hypothetical protein
MSDKYIIKMISKEEKMILKDILMNYHRFLVENPSSLITK